MKESIKGEISDIGGSSITVKHGIENYQNLSLFTKAQFLLNKILPWDTRPYSEIPIQRAEGHIGEEVTVEVRS